MNRMGDKGAMELARALRSCTLTSLEQLDVRKNGITDAGAEPLMKVCSRSNNSMDVDELVKSALPKTVITLRWRD
jgi:uncharacterized protein (UPF0262 family)